MQKAAGSSTVRASSISRPATTDRRFTAASPNAPPASSCADFFGRGGNFSPAGRDCFVAALLAMTVFYLLSLRAKRRNLDRSVFGSALFRRQLEEAVQLGKAAQLEVPELPDRPVEMPGEFLRHDQRAVEFAAEMLDPAGQVHIGADHGEIEPVAGADIAVGHRAVMQRDPSLEQRCAGPLAPVALGQGREALPRRGQRVAARLLCAATGHLMEEREHAVAHDLDDLAALL